MSTKSIALQSSKVRKKENEHRQEAENKLKENDDKVYKPPRGMNPRVAKIYVAIVEELKHAKVLNNLDNEIFFICLYGSYKVMLKDKVSMLIVIL